MWYGVANSVRSMLVCITKLEVASYLSPSLALSRQPNKNKSRTTHVRTYARTHARTRGKPAHVYRVDDRALPNKLLHDADASASSRQMQRGLLHESRREEGGKRRVNFEQQQVLYRAVPAAEPPRPKKHSDPSRTWKQSHTSLQRAPEKSTISQRLPFTTERQVTNR